MRWPAPWQALRYEPCLSDRDWALLPFGCTGGTWAFPQLPVCRGARCRFGPGRNEGPTMPLLRIQRNKIQRAVLPSPDGECLTASLTATSIIRWWCLMAGHTPRHRLSPSHPITALTGLFKGPQHRLRGMVQEGVHVAPARRWHAACCQLWSRWVQMSRAVMKCGACCWTRRVRRRTGRRRCSLCCSFVSDNLRRPLLGRQSRR